MNGRNEENNFYCFPTYVGLRVERRTFGIIVSVYNDPLYLVPVGQALSHRNASSRRHNPNTTTTERRLFSVRLDYIVFSSSVIQKASSFCVHDLLFLQ